MPPHDRSLEEKRNRALRRLADCGSAVVALSGGVDSAVLLALAIAALGRRRVLAATGNSPSVPADDLASAREVARELGARHEVVPTRELSMPEYRANRGDRCFHCRNELYAALGRLARARRFDVVAHGAIADDVGDTRPGMLAAERHGVLAPLLDAGLDKDDVRRLAREAGLSVADRPAGACLASRLPIGTQVTPERLSRVGQAEAALRALGFGQLRVRHHGPVARIELDPEGLSRLADPAIRSRVVAAVRDAGYSHVTADLAGYREGGADATGDSVAGRARGVAQRIGPDRSGGQKR
jgi:uncharacterized protein